MSFIFTNQDTFNKFVTTCTMVFVMIMFTYTTITGKTINITDVVTLISTMLATHGIHLVSNAVNQKTAATLTAVQTTQNGNGKANPNPQ